ncbi:MAG: tetratricopeptide repeat protein [Acidimicrobiales bacterium]
MNTVALFRGCLRKEYRDQIIKMLRAVPGEYTRTAYRFRWIDPAVLDLIESGETFRAVSFLVDKNLEHALPSRVMTLVEPPIKDDQIGVFRFVFQLGPYLSVPENFDTRLSTWEKSEGATPPDSFVTPLRPEWLETEEIGFGQSVDTWKRSIDFLTDTWDPATFGNTVFFRPHGGAYDGHPEGPSRRVRQSEETKFTFFSYNPHLSDDALSSRRIHASVGGVMGDVQPPPRLPRDGFLDLEVNFLEAGQGSVQVEILPDPQFSAYVPLAVRVDPNDQVDPTGPRVLGQEWTRFLDDIVRGSTSDRTRAAELLTRLSAVFPGDPELMVQRGRLHLLDQQYAAARDEFTKALLLRNDSRAVWWSLLTALFLDQPTDAVNLLERVDLSSGETNTVLFEEVVDAMAHVSDQTVEWFAELPGMVMSEDKAARLLLAMAERARGESAVAAIVRSLGAINPQLAIRVAHTALQSSPDWSVVRREVVALALSSGLLELAGDDADVLIHYGGGDVDEYLGTVQTLRPLLHPERLPGLLLTNAIGLDRGDDIEARRASMVLAYMAADQAASNGDFILAQQAIQFIELRLVDSDDWNIAYRAQINEVITRMTRVMDRSPDLSRLEEMYAQELANDVREEYRDKHVVVFGGRDDSVALSDLEEILELAELSWVKWEGSTQPNPSKLREVLTDESTLVIMSLDDGLITDSVRTWLRTMRVPTIRAIQSTIAVLHALKAVLPSSSGSVTFIPASCSEAVDWVRNNCPRIEFSARALDELRVLEGLPNRAHVARRIKQDLETLDKYALATSGGSDTIDFFNFAKLDGYASSSLAMKESEGTGNNPVFRAARTFPVPRTVDPSSRIYMPAHFKLPGTFPNVPRIHFTLDGLSSTGKVWVGYVGPHLENSRS